MYEQFFSLHGKPFDLTPDPKFYFPSSEHKKALAYLRYGLSKGEGFVLVTGVAGTGKSIVTQKLLASLPTDQYTIGYIVFTKLAEQDLLKMVAAALGLGQSGLTGADLLIHLERAMKRKAGEGKRLLLVIDEVHNLGPEQLEVLRMLTNFQLGNRPCLQLFLVGQEMFRATVSRADLAQLRQRVVAACHLQPLGPEEIGQYVRHRLHCVGWKDDPCIVPDVHALIFEYSQGLPRLINTACDRLLLDAYLEERHTITRASASKVINELIAELLPMEGVDAAVGEESVVNSEADAIAVPDGTANREEPRNVVVGFSPAMSRGPGKSSRTVPGSVEGGHPESASPSRLSESPLAAPEGRAGADRAVEEPSAESEGRVAGDAVQSDPSAELSRRELSEPAVSTGMPSAVPLPPPAGSVEEAEWGTVAREEPVERTSSTTLNEPSTEPSTSPSDMATRVSAEVETRRREANAFELDADIAMEEALLAMESDRRHASRKRAGMGRWVFLLLAVLVAGAYGTRSHWQKHVEPVMAEATRLVGTAWRQVQELGDGNATPHATPAGGGASASPSAPNRAAFPVTADVRATTGGAASMNTDAGGVRSEKPAVTEGARADISLAAPEASKRGPALADAAMTPAGVTPGSPTQGIENGTEGATGQVVAAAQSLTQSVNEGAQMGLGMEQAAAAATTRAPTTTADPHDRELAGETPSSELEGAGAASLPSAASLAPVNDPAAPPAGVDARMRTQRSLTEASAPEQRSAAAYAVDGPARSGPSLDTPADSTNAEQPMAVAVSSGAERIDVTPATVAAGQLPSQGALPAEVGTAGANEAGEAAQDKATGGGSEGRESPTAEVAVTFDGSTDATRQIGPSETDVAQALAAYTRAYGDGDLATITALLGRNCQYNGRPCVGAYTDYLERVFRTSRVRSIEFRNMRWQYGRWQADGKGRFEIEYTGAREDTLVREQGEVLVTFIREDARTRISQLSLLRSSRVRVEVNRGGPNS